MFSTHTQFARTASLAAGLFAVVIAFIPHSAAANDLGDARDCVIGPYRVVDVSSAVPGLLESVSVERSDVVVSGQKLARLESAVEQASVALADAWASIRSEIRLESISRSLDSRRMARIERLYNSQAVALDDKDQAETEAMLADVRLRQAREKRWIRELDAAKAEALLERRTVRSPIDGVVVERFRSGGEYVENQPIARIAQLDPLQIETILPMRQFGSVQPGMQATVRAEHDPDLTLTATVSVVDRVGDAASGTFGVRLSLANPDHRIPAGVKCTLELLPMPVVAMSAAPANIAKATSEDMPAASIADFVVDGAIDPATSAVITTIVPHTQTESPFTDSGAEPPAIANSPHVPVALGPAAATDSSCLAIGPLDDENTAQRLMSGLAVDEAETALHEDETHGHVGYIVVSTPPPGGGMRHVERMRAAGVEDLLLMGSGTFRGLVTLGVYDRAPAAERRRTQIAALGFDTEVRTRTRRSSHWWVALNSANSDEAAVRARAVLDSLPATTAAQIMPCSAAEPLSAQQRTTGDARPRV